MVTKKSTKNRGVPKVGWDAILKSHPNFKTNPKISAIVKLYALNPIPLNKIATRFGIHASRVSTILRDPLVKEEVRRIRDEAYELSLIRFRGLADKAVTKVDKALNTDESGRLSLDVLKGVGIAQPDRDNVPLSVSFILPTGVDIEKVAGGNGNGNGNGRLKQGDE